MSGRTARFLASRHCSAIPASRLISTRLFGPLALAEDGRARAVLGDAVDVDPVGADHPVDVDQALVAALGSDLLRRQFGAADEAFRIALAERDMARGVLIEER